jgi:hypothetical protein
MKPISLNKINSIKQILLPHHFEDNGNLVVMEGLVDVPFEIARVFVVFAGSELMRGHHAHRLCSQFLVCSSGAVEVLCTDGSESISFLLNEKNVGLLIPPGIWSEQRYKGTTSILTVLCNRPYEANDYIRDYAEFLDYQKVDY